MRQTRAASWEFADRKPEQRHGVCLPEMQQTASWPALITRREPRHPIGGRVDRRPISVSRMLTMHLSYRLSDESPEDPTCNCQAKRAFAGIGLAGEQEPNATERLKVRRIQEDHALEQTVFEQINEHPGKSRLGFAIVIAAPPSTKIKSRGRDRDTHQVKTSDPWSSGIDACVGTGTESGSVRSVHRTAVVDWPFNALPTRSFVAGALQQSYSI